MFKFIKKLLKNSEKSPVANERLPEIFINDSVTVHKDEENPKLWRGRVNSVSAHTFSVDIPLLMGEFPFPFREKKLVMVTITRENRTARFSTILEKIAWKAKPPILVLEYPERIQWEEVKERKFIRIPTNIPARIKPKKDETAPQVFVRLTDFSVTGISFLSFTPYAAGDLLEVEIMSTQFKVKHEGEVIKSTKLEEHGANGEPNYRVSLRFLKLSELDINNLSAFAHQLQRTSTGGSQ